MVALLKQPRPVALPVARALSSHLLEAVERCAGDLLRRSSLKAGAAPSDVARALGFSVEWEPGLRARAALFPFDRAIVLSPTSDRREAEFSVAHELMHAWCAEIDTSRGVSHEAMELTCDRGAAALLLPRLAFIDSAKGCGWSAPSLARKWFHAPRTVVVQRIAELRRAD